jgi:hypothetical protein
MEQNLKILFKQIMEEMKRRVIENLEEVKSTQGKLSIDEARQFEYDFKLYQKQKYNKTLLAENKDFLELQLKIVAFVNKYYKSELMNIPVSNFLERHPEKIDYYSETIQGKIKFDEYHPYYFDSNFIDKLIEFYLSAEDYNECNRLKQIKIKVTSLIKPHA